MKTESYFYKDKPIFGLDIGFSSVKVMQIDQTDKPTIVGYGVGSFEPTLIKDGEIVNFEILAQSINDLFKNKVVGEINTRRVSFTVPASKTFSRVIKLPDLSAKELAEAVQTEAEQYIPVPIDELYMDYNIINRTEKETELFAVAVHKKVIDSYMALSQILGLEAVAIESTIGSAARSFQSTNTHNIPTILIDFGSITTDITIFDKTLVVTGTVPGGGDTFAEKISTALGVTRSEANVIKTKYGLDFSKKQKEITAALKPFLDQLLKELGRMMRYYEERFGSSSKLDQVVTMGGGANMPGLNEYLTNQLRLPVQTSDPWQHIAFGKLEQPDQIDRSMYVTVSGAALINSSEIFS